MIDLSDFSIRLQITIQMLISFKFLLILLNITQFKSLINYVGIYIYVVNNLKL